jgi:murein DD-endopeptidase MepM/ murein hydrolase activator NlpD
MELMVNYKIENFLRMALCCAAIVYFPHAALKPVVAFSNYIFAKSSNADGIGGQAYPAAELEEISVASDESEQEVVIPVPEEYSAPQLLLFSAHKIQKGDMIGALAESFGLNQGTIVSVNGIKNSRAIYPNEVLKIPNQDGIMHSVSSGESIASIAQKYSVEPEPLITANELFGEKVNSNTKLFIPGAKLDYAQLQEINGDLFIWPVRGRITSRYGYRISPFSGARTFHTGIDLSGVTGTPIKAAMSGRVTSAGYNNVFGNYVVIAHHSNYRTLYGHMSSIRVRNGVYVRTGEIIGYVGNTGLSTGSHLHFTVYKNGRTVNPLVLIN